MTVTADYADLLSHSEATDEVYVLARILAGIVAEVRDGGLWPPRLVELAGEAAGRASVQRRLKEITKEGVV